MSNHMDPLEFPAGEAPPDETDAAHDEADADDDGYPEVTPTGYRVVCEDAPCCGCCGTLPWEYESYDDYGYYCDDGGTP